MLERRKRLASDQRRYSKSKRIIKDIEEEISEIQRTDRGRKGMWARPFGPEVDPRYFDLPYDTLRYEQEAAASCLNNTLSSDQEENDMLSKRQAQLDTYTKDRLGWEKMDGSPRRIEGRSAVRDAKFLPFPDQLVLPINNATHYSILKISSVDAQSEEVLTDKYQRLEEQSDIVNSKCKSHSWYKQLNTELHKLEKLAYEELKSPEKRKAYETYYILEELLLVGRSRRSHYAAITSYKLLKMNLFTEKSVYLLKILECQQLFAIACFLLQENNVKLARDFVIPALGQHPDFDVRILMNTLASVPSVGRIHVHMFLEHFSRDILEKCLLQVIESYRYELAAQIFALIRSPSQDVLEKCLSYFTELNQYELVAKVLDLISLPLQISQALLEWCLLHFTESNHHQLVAKILTLIDLSSQDILQKGVIICIKRDSDALMSQNLYPRYVKYLADAKPEELHDLFSSCIEQARSIDEIMKLIKFMMHESGKNDSLLARLRSPGCQPRSISWQDVFVTPTWILLMKQAKQKIMGFIKQTKGRAGRMPYDEDVHLFLDTPTTTFQAACQSLFSSSHTGKSEEYKKSTVAQVSDLKELGTESSAAGSSRISMKGK